MLKNIINFSIITFITIYLGLLLILPLESFRLGYYSEIFPAIDLIIIYSLSINRIIKYWHLFILGLVLDQFYHMPSGTNSLVLLIANILLIVINRWFLVKDYLANLIVFCGYSLFVISFKYIIIVIFSTNYLEGFAIYFYYFTTILSYPIIKIIIEKPLKMLNSHAE